MQATKNLKKIQLTDRDDQILSWLHRDPHLTSQLLKRSRTLPQPFSEVSLLRRRLRKLRDSGYIKFFTSIDGEQYYKLSPQGYRYLHGLEDSASVPDVFEPMKPLTQLHHFPLLNVVIHLYADAHRSCLTIKTDLGDRQNSFDFLIGDLIPDRTLEFVTTGGKVNRVFLELDNSTETLRTKKDKESWTRKIMMYEQLRDNERDPFRVHVVATKSFIRLQNILDLAKEVSQRPDRPLFTGSHIATLLAARHPLVQPWWLAAEGKAVPMVYGQKTQKKLASALVAC